MRPAAVLVLVAVALAARQASAEDLFERARKIDPTIRFGEIGALTIQPLLQTRWIVAESSRAERDTVAGFSVPRARLTLTTSLFDTVRFRLRVGAEPNGNARFEQAYLEATWRRLSFHAGQFALPLNLGEEPLPQDLSAADFSSYANTFSGGQTQGLEAIWEGPVRLSGTVGNGARTGFSELLSPLVAEIATTGRVAIPIGATTSRFDGFGVQPSFRRGQKPAARIGATVHYQTRPATDSSPANQIVLVGGDVDVRGSGYAVLASMTYLRLEQRNGAPPNEAMGFMLLGSVFPARRVELWAQLDAVWPTGTVTPVPPSFANGQPGTTPLRTLTVGSSFYVVPDVNRLKVQLDMQTLFDGQITSVVPPSVTLGVLRTSGPQVAARVQLVVAL